MAKIKILGRCMDDNKLQFVITYFEPIGGNYRIAVCQNHYDEFTKHDVIEIKKINGVTDV